MKLLILSVIFFCSLITIAFADSFFWEDKNGVHMVNDPSKLPPKFKTKYNKMVAGRPKKETVPESASNAIKALKKLGARTEAGILYKDYPSALGEAKFEVNQLLEDDKSDSLSNLKKTVQEAMVLYEFAGTIWEVKFNREADYGFIFIDSSCCPYSKVVASAYFSKFPEDKKDAAEGGVLEKQLGNKMSISRALSKIWERASQKSSDAATILKSYSK